MTKITEAREEAINAIIRYALELYAAGYNKKCIRDSVMVLAGDVIGRDSVMVLAGDVIGDEIS